LHAIIVGAAGPLAALAALRLLDRADARAITYLAVPLACLAAVSMAGWMSKRLLRGEGAATK
jgi:hypothetical protein